MTANGRIAYLPEPECGGGGINIIQGKEGKHCE
jgi:hypothetical protein